jgi:hypothetical protein
VAAGDRRARPRRQFWRDLDLGLGHSPLKRQAFGWSRAVRWSMRASRLACGKTGRRLFEGRYRDDSASHDISEPCVVDDATGWHR